MADKRGAEEARNAVLNEDATRDVNMTLGVIVAGTSMISSGAAALAVLAIVFLANFRSDVDNLWLCCIPLCFSFVTGVAVAYRKQMADVGVHIAIVMTTLLAGGAGYGLSVEPVYFNRDNCTDHVGHVGECNKEILTTMYFIAGAVASGFAVLGLLASLCTCSNAMSRRARRERYKLMRLEYEENRRKGEVRDQKRRIGQSTIPSHAPTIPTSSPTSNGTFGKPATTPKVNGVNGVKNGAPNAPLLIINEQPEVAKEEPEVTEQEPKVIEGEPKVIGNEPDVIKEHSESPKEQSVIAKELPEVAKEEPETTKNQSEILKDVPEVNATTIIVRDFNSEKRKKQLSGVDRGTQVEPMDTVIGPAKRDVGVSPYQQLDDEVIPTSVVEVPTSPEDKVSVQNGESDTAAKVMTHL